MWWRPHEHHGQYERSAAADLVAVVAGEEGAEDGKRKLMPTEAKDNSSPMGAQLVGLGTVGGGADRGPAPPRSRTQSCWIYTGTDGAVAKLR